MNAYALILIAASLPTLVDYDEATPVQKKGTET